MGYKYRSAVACLIRNFARKQGRSDISPNGPALGIGLSLCITVPAIEQRLLDSFRL